MGSFVSPELRVGDVVTTRWPSDIRVALSCLRTSSNEWPREILQDIDNMQLYLRLAYLCFLVGHGISWMVALMQLELMGPCHRQICINIQYNDCIRSFLRVKVCRKDVVRLGQRRIRAIWCSHCHSHVTGTLPTAGVCNYLIGTGVVTSVSVSSCYCCLTT